mmetsp:Transcript_5299/g.10099  ORF Transcript_5299/g.10099 Transcript_5299/m.10099 type:complete len:146 (+) Transcript_5299:535-972(+)
MTLWLLLTTPLYSVGVHGSMNHVPIEEIIPEAHTSCYIMTEYMYIYFGTIISTTKAYNPGACWCFFLCLLNLVIVVYHDNDDKTLESWRGHHQQIIIPPPPQIKYNMDNETLHQWLLLLHSTTRSSMRYSYRQKITTRAVVYLLT